MLIVKIVNTGGPNNAAMYTVDAFVNTRRIYHGTAGPHDRDTGWIMLVQQALHKALETDPQDNDASSNECPCCLTPVRTVRRFL